METQPHKIVLKTGYTDQQGQTHKEVTFGNPVTAAIMFAIEENPMGSLYTQKELLLASHAITAFGSVKIPVSLTTLLDLDEFDVNDLLQAHDQFNEQRMAGREVEFISESQVKLPIGFTKDGLNYNRAIFGRQITGRDMANADSHGFQEFKRQCFLIGRQIISITTEDGLNELSGPIAIEMFNDLEGADILALRLASERWRVFFRHQREKVQGDVGAQHLDTSHKDGLAGEPNT